MRRFALALCLLGVMVAEAQQRASVSRAEMAAMEKSFDDKLRRFNLDSPMEILGLTRGLYLEGYGAVFTAEVNLLQTPGVSPFRAEFTPEEIARIRAAKVSRIPQVKTMMRTMMLASAQSLDRVPPEEQIAVALFLLSKPWEDKAGLPQQIVLQAKRKALLDLAANRIQPAEAQIEERIY